MQMAGHFLFDYLKVLLSSLCYFVRVRKLLDSSCIPTAHMSGRFIIFIVACFFVLESLDACTDIKLKRLPIPMSSDDGRTTNFTLSC